MTVCNKDCKLCEFDGENWVIRRPPSGLEFAHGVSSGSITVIQGYCPRCGTHLLRGGDATQQTGRTAAIEAIAAAMCYTDCDKCPHLERCGKTEKGKRMLAEAFLSFQEEQAQGPKPTEDESP